MSKIHILFVDDDPKIGTMVKQYLEEDGHIVHVASCGAESLDIMTKEKDNIDIVLLDMVLPDYDGLSLLREYHTIKPGLPVIVVSGKGDAADKIVGLEMGADDYLVKPFHLRELSARIKTVLRRSEAPSSAETASQNKKLAQQADEQNMKLHFNGWEMDCRKYEVIGPDGTPIPFTSGEFEMLLALARSAHKILSRERLFEVTRGVQSEAYDRAVDIQIGRLRKKLNDDPRAPTFIKTVRGVGYMFIADVEKEHLSAA